MEISSLSGLSEVGIDNPNFFNQWQAPHFDEFSIQPIAAALGEDIQSSFAQPTINFKASAENTNFSVNTLAKQPKTSSWASAKVDTMPNNQAIASPYTDSNSSNQHVFAKPKDGAVCPKIMSNLPYEVSFSQGLFGNQNYPSHKACRGGKWARTSCGRLSQTQDHIMAERKRREKLGQRFIALSALIPGLKKMDKASVLGDAIKHLKQLQDRVKVLEEQSEKRATEAAVFVKKLHLCDDGLDEGDSANGPFDEPLPEIEVRVSDRNVLVRVHCQKSEGVLQKIVAEVHKLHLNITNSSFMTFGASSVDITLMAQMNPKFNASAKDLVQNLRLAFKSFQ